MVRVTRVSELKVRVRMLPSTAALVNYIPFTGNYTLAEGKDPQP